MNTFSDQAVVGRRRRRVHSDEFKANVVAACMRPGMSMAAVAMVNGINANLLRALGVGRGDSFCRQPAQCRVAGPQTPCDPAPFSGLRTDAAAGPDPGRRHRIELHRGATTISVSWPVDAAPTCAAWIRELLQ